MIHVIATIEVAEGKREAFLAEFRRIVPLVHAEAGCLEYGPTVDAGVSLPVPVPLRENVVVIIEKWQSLDALRAHFTAPHMQEYRGRVKDLVVRVQLQVLQPAG
jgi:quinol monooxygenase YgiN